jgi:hypothetical protein
MKEYVRAVRVFVNNAPIEFHIHRARLSDQWGKPSLAVCDTEETAEFIAKAVNALIDSEKKKGA